MPASSVTSVAELGHAARTRYVLGLGAQKLAAVLKDLRVDAVLAHFAVEGAYAAPAARIAGVPLVTVVHGFDATVSRRSLLTSRKVSWMHYACTMHRLRQSGDLFLPVSDHLREVLVERGFPVGRTRTHHLGIDLGRFPASDSVRSPTRTVVHVGRLVPKKGHRVLLEALGQMPADVRLVLVGAGPLRAALEEQAERLEIADRVTFVGGVDNASARSFIADADVLCLPSITAPSGDQEGLGQVLLEAGALGRPVVATRHGGITSAVIDGVTGTLVSEGSVEELATALLQYLDDPDLARRTGQAGLRHVRENFDVRRQTAILEGLLDSMLLGGRT